MPDFIVSDRKLPVLALIAGIGSASGVGKRRHQRLLQPEGLFQRALQPHDFGQFAFDADLHLVARPGVGQHAHDGDAADAKHIGDLVLRHLLDEIHPGGANPRGDPSGFR